MAAGRWPEECNGCVAYIQNKQTKSWDKIKPFFHLFHLILSTLIKPSWLTGQQKHKDLFMYLYIVLAIMVDWATKTQGSIHGSLYSSSHHG